MKCFSFALLIHRKSAHISDESTPEYVKHDINDGGVAGSTRTAPSHRRYCVEGPGERLQNNHKDSEPDKRHFQVFLLE
ncbi:unnamed protein product [Nippostrongylus brasiliensis]|uniref:Secreted protein n=1 Tax=Nippostrongylus brasiliensis TaxID=27835 RepID=A0A0N4Y3Y6_NIPBR|nr:hypothetical protein Q1695_000482 [Nippostrongylus brasiliensis]VDL74153.1 unnamed protein product [Nippostrongylus brasiliensis]